MFRIIFPFLEAKNHFLIYHLMWYTLYNKKSMTQHISIWHNTTWFTQHYMFYTTQPDKHNTTLSTQRIIVYTTQHDLHNTNPEMRRNRIVPTVPRRASCRIQDKLGIRTTILIWKWKKKLCKQHRAIIIYNGRGEDLNKEHQFKRERKRKRERFFIRVPRRIEKGKTENENRGK